MSLFDRIEIAKKVAEETADKVLLIANDGRFFKIDYPGSKDWLVDENSSGYKKLREMIKFKIYERYFRTEMMLSDIRKVFWHAEPGVRVKKALEEILSEYGDIDNLPEYEGIDLFSWRFGRVVIKEKAKAKVLKLVELQRKLAEESESVKYASWGINQEDVSRTNELISDLGGLVKRQELEMFDLRDKGGDINILREKQERVFEERYREVYSEIIDLIKTSIDKLEFDEDYEPSGEFQFGGGF